MALTTYSIRPLAVLDGLTREDRKSMMRFSPLNDGFLVLADFGSTELERAAEVIVGFSADLYA